MPTLHLPPHFGRLSLVIIGLAALVIIGTVQWQTQQVWAGCTIMPDGTGDRTWIQGANISFGFPSTWRTASCDSHSTHYKVSTSPESIWWPQSGHDGWLDINQSRVDNQTLAKLLAAWHATDFHGQRRAWTTRVDGLDGLVMEQLASDNRQYQQQVVFIKNFHQFTFTWHKTAASASEGKQLLTTAKNPTKTHFDELLTTVRFQ